MDNTGLEYAQNIVNTVREPLVVLDDKFRVISANRSFYSTFKVTTEMSENTLLFDLGDGQWEIPRLRELLEKVLPESTSIEDFEVEHDFPAIGRKTMLLNARRIRSKTGATQILLAIEDVTERKRRQDELRDARNYAQNIVNTVREPLVVLDDKLRVLSANRSFYSTFKVTPEMSENTLLYDLGNGQWEIPRLRELLEEVLPKSTTIEDFEVEHDFPAIGQKTMLINARRMRHETGAKQIILLAIEDVTERKAFEETLHQSEEKYRTLFESSWDALMTLAPPSWRFTSCNHAALEVFRAKDESEFTSFGSWDLSPDLQPDGQLSTNKAREMIDKALREGSFLFEWTHRRLGGEEFPAAVLLTRMEIGGETVVKATVRDITERKVAEKALLRANKELEGYAHTVSHDLKGPLSNVVMAAEMLSDSLEGGDGEAPGGEAGEMLRIIGNSTGRAMMLIDDLLVLAEAGAAPGELEAVDISEVVRSVLKEKEELLKDHGVRVSVDDDLGVAAMDPTHAYQVFSNLVGNAIKYNDSENPEIRISRLGEAETGRLRYLASDNGPGIPEADIEDIFLPFHKGASSTDTGIGLSIVEKVVRLYGGEIRAYNENGACFEFTLPIQSP